MRVQPLPLLCSCPAPSQQGSAAGSCTTARAPPLCEPASPPLPFPCTAASGIWHPRGGRPCLPPAEHSATAARLQGLGKVWRNVPAPQQLHGPCLCSRNPLSGGVQRSGPEQLGRAQPSEHCPAVHHMGSTSLPLLQHAQQPSGGSQLLTLSCPAAAFRASATRRWQLCRAS